MEIVKFDLKHCFGVILCGTVLLLESCTPFRAREVDLDKRSEQESKNYYQFTAGGGDSLSFESRNFLSSNLLMRDFRNDGEKLPGKCPKCGGRLKKREIQLFS